MPWPIPQPGDIFNRAAAVFEAEFARLYLLQNPSLSPTDVHVDARSANSQLAIYGRTVDMTAQDLWFFLVRVVQELMPDTAIDWLPRHAAIWGVPQIQASAAIGNAIFTSAAGVAVPSGLALSQPGGLTYVTTAAVTIAANSSASIPVACTTTGSSGSLPPGTVLTVVNPLAGLTTQTATVDSSGLTGQNAEALPAWQARLLARIRNRGAGGNGNDFDEWTQEVMPGALVAAMSPGAGFITVAFAMPSGQSWIAPTSAQIAAVSAYLNDAQNRKPLGCPVVNVVAATLQPVDFTIHLSPDTTANRAAATSALTLQMLADATIGGTIYMSRMDAALQNADGEFSHERTAPTADVTAASTTVSTFGGITFV
jgi:uncharacterized phage protein gp47/JayE